MIAAIATLLLLQAEPSPPRITVSLAEPSLVLGVHQETEVQISVDPALAGSPVRVHCSAGRVEDLITTGAGRYSGRYVLPPERYPQVGIIVAEVEEAGRPVRGAAFIRLRAAASPAFRTDPGASVTLRIGDKDFGPQVAAEDGAVRVPVVVPPGVGYGIARSQNPRGAATEQTIDLRTPPFRRLLIVAPDRMPAGGVAEAAVYATDPSGTPAETATIVVRTAAGKPHPLGGPPGEARFLVRAPEGLRERTLRLEALLEGQPSTGVVHDIVLVPAAPAQVVLAPDRTRLPIGRDSSMRVYLSAQDRFGNPADAAPAAVFVDGTRVATRSADDGRVMAVVPAPARYQGRDHVRVDVVLGEAHAEQRVPLANLPPPPSPQLARQLRPPRLTVTPRLGILWNLRQAPGPSFLVETMARRQGWSGDLLVGIALGYLGSESVLRSSIGLGRLSVEHFPALALFRLRFQPRPRLALSGGAGVGISFARTELQALGYAVRGGDLAAVLDASGELAILLQSGQIVLGGRYLLIPMGRLSTGDEVAGNSGGLVADVGYRLVW